MAPRCTNARRPSVRAPIANACGRLLSPAISISIATDHSPCPPEMKTRGNGSFLEAWGGIASLQLALPVVWTEASKRNIPHRVRRALDERATCQAGRPQSSQRGIQVGQDADLVVFDPDAQQRVDPAGLQHRHPITPYAWRDTAKASLRMTFVRGEKVFDRGTFADPPKGLECSRA